jgi:prepilin-type N-terminal cleavage/methylation domain-containing protein
MNTPRVGSVRRAPKARRGPRGRRPAPPYRRASAPPSAREAHGGFTLAEVIVSILVFAVVVLGLLQMALVARQQTRAGQLKTDMWSVAQVTIEEITATSFDSISAGSDNVMGYPVAWTVAGTSPKTVTLVVQRPSVLGGIVADTFVTQVADWEGS